MVRGRAVDWVKSLSITFMTLELGQPTGGSRVRLTLHVRGAGGNDLSRRPEWGPVLRVHMKGPRRADTYVAEPEDRW